MSHTSSPFSGLQRSGLQRSGLRRFTGNYGQELVVLLTIALLFVVVGTYNPDRKSVV